MELDILVKVWAVIAPVSAALLSAWWSRRNQLQDRAYETERELRLRQFSLQDREAERESVEREKRLDSIRLAYVKFIASSNEYALQASTDQILTEGVLSEKARESLMLMNESFHGLSILGGTKIHDAATDVLNLSLALGSRIDEIELIESREKFKLAKHNLLLVISGTMGERAPERNMIESQSAGQPTPKSLGASSPRTSAL
jgi:hypothetical protein